jgi:hypothetical protein
MSFMATLMIVSDGQASWLEALAQAHTELGIPAAYKGWKLEPKNRSKAKGRRATSGRLWQHWQSDHGASCPFSSANKKRTAFPTRRLTLSRAHYIRQSVRGRLAKGEVIAVIEVAENGHVLRSVETELSKLMMKRD